MEALDGPLRGKMYTGLPEHTKTIIDYYQTPHGFYCVTYIKTDKGWKFTGEIPYGQLPTTKALDGEADEYTK